SSRHRCRTSCGRRLRCRGPPSACRHRRGSCSSRSSRALTRRAHGGLQQAIPVAGSSRGCSMKLYGFPLSPFVRKVMVAAREKGLEYELVPANPNQPSEEFLKISPFSKIPALSDGDFCLADSTAIVTYLEAKHPEPPLLPAEPRARGRAIWFEEMADTVLIPAGAPILINRFLRPLLFGTEGDEEAAKAGEQAVLKPLDYLEGELGDDGWL